MDFHLERQLRLIAEPEHKNLYSWAINEIGESGDALGSDQIPWPWTLYFTATSCVLSDILELESNFSKAEEDQPPSIIRTERQIIHANLRPGPVQNDEASVPETHYSMFGTDRRIEDFQLVIRPTTDPSEKEHCSAWGSPSYTSEIDFRDETINDCVVFSLFVKSDTFAQYATKISDGLVDNLVLTVGSVDGFYSEWSPSISTSTIKVLTSGEEHKVEIPGDLSFEPPRLGSVGEATLHIIRAIKLAPGNPGEEAEDETNDVDTDEYLTHQARISTSDLNRQVLIVLASLKRASWWIVALLFLILVTALTKS